MLKFVDIPLKKPSKISVNERKEDFREIYNTDIVTRSEIRTDYLRKKYHLNTKMLRCPLTNDPYIFEIDSLFTIQSSNSLQLLSKFFIIIAALGYMISNIVAYNTLKHINSFSITFFATIFGALISIPFLIFSEISQPSYISVKSILPLLYLGIFPTALAFQLRYHITKTSGPVFLSYVAYFIPI